MYIWYRTHGLPCRYSMWKLIVPSMVTKLLNGRPRFPKHWEPELLFNNLGGLNCRGIVTSINSIFREQIKSSYELFSLWLCLARTWRLVLPMGNRLRRENWKEHKKRKQKEILTESRGHFCGVYIGWWMQGPVWFV